ncbi:MAG: flagellar hook-associated protein FlgK [Mycobacterium leprae]
MQLNLATALNGAVRSMQSAQFALNVSSRNIARANDPTYTRQVVVPDGGTVNGGPGVQRLRDIFLDTQYRLAAGSEGEAGVQKDVLSQVEDVFGDPVNGGVGKTLNEFFNQWQNLAENPADPIVRMQVVAAGQSFVTEVKQAYSQLQTIQGSVNSQLADKVNQVNDKLQQIYDLNLSISDAGRTNMSDADLRDKRDALLDDLAKLTGAKVRENPDSTVSVFIGNKTALDGPTVKKLSLVTKAGDTDPSVVWANDLVGDYGGGGQITGLVAVRENQVKPIMNDLDKFTQDVVAEVNSYHGTANVTDPAKTNFFVVAGGPMNIAVNPAINANTLEPGYSGDPADGTRARDIAGVADTPMFNSIVLPDRVLSPKEYYRDLIGYIGSTTQMVNNNQEIAQAHVDAAQQHRQSEWGVSLDEEASGLMLQQQAFAAAARVINTADQMMNSLLTSVGIS